MSRVLKPKSVDGEMVLSPDDKKAMDDVESAYDEIKIVNPLDLTETGLRSFEVAKGK